MCTLLTLLFVFTVSSQEVFECSLGCISTVCMANNTCPSGCIVGYENGDTSCSHCVNVNDTDYSNPVYLKVDGECKKTTPLLQKNSWVPDKSTLPGLTADNEIVYLNFDSNTHIDKSPCYYKQPYRQGKWLKFDTSTLGSDIDFIAFNLSKEVLTDFNVYVDVSNSDSTEEKPFCLSHYFLRGDSHTNRMKIPITFNNKNTEKMLYIFVSVDGFEQFTAGIRIYEDPGNTLYMYYNLNQKETDLLRSDLSSSLTYDFPFEEYGMFGYGICAPNVIFSYISFTLNFKGNYSIQINTKAKNKLLYLQEYRIKPSEGQTIEKAPAECKTLWVGEKHGVLTKPGTEMGINVKIDQNREEDGNDIRYFSLMTQELKLTSKVTIKAICPNQCNIDLNQGICSVEKGTCICNDGFGGDDCHLKCYYNNTWREKENANLCYFGSAHCDQWCGCEKGYTLVDHFCVSNTCLNGGLSSDEECFRGSEGCFGNCYCQEGLFVKTSDKKCRSLTCGNNKIENIYDSFGNLVRAEECDNGTNCNSLCFCEEGFEPNPDELGSCIPKPFPTWGYVAISILSFSGLCFFVVVSIVVFLFFSRYRRINTNLLVQRQPSYYYYIQKSSNLPSAKENKYEIIPNELDFGNSEDVTEIFETRFQRIRIHNHSRNKWMMVIFHTPNNPKFVFHFEPQVVFVRARTTMKNEMCYMTLYCTTKIRNMKIPYTVWFSKSKSTLKNIADSLKDKTFENWDKDDQKAINKLWKNVSRECHHNLTITTDSITSIHIDLDEIAMAEQPIAEGANGKVFIGVYRSLPVAVKQFKWDNVSEGEMAELKEEAMDECELMSKLRNPFVASYVGSVTYTPQVSMVMQYFQLGSLGEYLRKENSNYFLIPYRLKVRILFDTARGMRFLHENNIKHLDLKPDNLLVNSFYFDSACCIKITDFGTSRFKKRKREDKGLGTPIYAAPETNKDEYTFSGDVYSFAVTAWELFYQEEPYKEFKSIFEIRNYVESGKRLGIDELMPVEYKEMIAACWRHYPNERPTFDQICKLLVKIDEKAEDHTNLDGNVSFEKMEEIVNKKNNVTRRLITELTHDD